MIRSVKIDYGKQRRLDEFKPVIFHRIKDEFDYLIREYEKEYNTDKYDKYDLYDFTWKVRGNLRIKNIPRNGFYSAYHCYQKIKK